MAIFTDIIVGHHLVAIKPIRLDEIRRNPYGCLELALDMRDSDNRGVQDEVLSKYIFIKGMELDEAGDAGIMGIRTGGFLRECASFLMREEHMFEFDFNNT